MMPWLHVGGAGDPGRVHFEGRVARAAIEGAREEVAALLRTRPRQIVFTSSATEAANSAVWGASRALPGSPIVCSGVEHSSVRDASRRAAPVVEVPVDGAGRVAVDAVDEAVSRAGGPGKVALVNCQWANHEVGTTQPARAVAHRCRELGVACHVDAAAAAGHVELDVEDLAADLVTVSSHKMGGPGGAGALVLRRGLRIEPLILGGEQERARRAGMEDTAAIVGFGAAARALAGGALHREGSMAREQTGRLLALAGSMEGVDVYGDPRGRVPHIVCLGVRGVEAEAVVLALDQRGVAVHSGSACSSESLSPSPVLEAMGVDSERSLRISVGWSTTERDVGAVAAALPDAVASLRALRT